jgi:hypothetical protein
MLQEALSFFSLHFLLSLFLFFGFFSAFLFSLFPFVQLRKWTLSQRVETRNGVKWRLASPGDSEEPAKPTLWVGNVLTERRLWRTVRGEVRTETMKYFDPCVQRDAINTRGELVAL